MFLCLGVVVVLGGLGIGLGGGWVCMGGWVGSEGSRLGDGAWGWAWGLGVIGFEAVGWWYVWMSARYGCEVVWMGGWVGGYAGVWENGEGGRDEVC